MTLPPMDTGEGRGDSDRSGAGQPESGGHQGLAALRGLQGRHNARGPCNHARRLMAMQRCPPLPDTTRHYVLVHGVFGVFCSIVLGKRWHFPAKPRGEGTVISNRTRGS